MKHKEGTRLYIPIPFGVLIVENSSSIEVIFEKHGDFLRNILKKLQNNSSDYKFFIFLKIEQDYIELSDASISSINASIISILNKDFAHQSGKFIIVANHFGEDSALLVHRATGLKHELNFSELQLRISDGSITAYVKNNELTLPWRQTVVDSEEVSEPDDNAIFYNNPSLPWERSICKKKKIVQIKLDDAILKRTPSGFTLIPLKYKSSKPYILPGLLSVDRSRIHISIHPLFFRESNNLISIIHKAILYLHRNYKICEIKLLLPINNEKDVKSIEKLSSLSTELKITLPNSSDILFDFEKRQLLPINSDGTVSDWLTVQNGKRDSQSQNTLEKTQIAELFTSIKTVGDNTILRMNSLLYVASDRKLTNLERLKGFKPFDELSFLIFVKEMQNLKILLTFIYSSPFLRDKLKLLVYLNRNEENKIELYDNTLITLADFFERDIRFKEITSINTSSNKQINFQAKDVIVIRNDNTKIIGRKLINQPPQKNLVNQAPRQHARQNLTLPKDEIAEKIENFVASNFNENRFDNPKDEEITKEELHSIDKTTQLDRGDEDILDAVNPIDQFEEAYSTGDDDYQPQLRTERSAANQKAEPNRTNAALFKEIGEKITGEFTRKNLIRQQKQERDDPPPRGSSYMKRKSIVDNINNLVIKVKDSNVNDTSLDKLFDSLQDADEMLANEIHHEKREVLEKSAEEGDYVEQDKAQKKLSIDETWGGQLRSSSDKTPEDDNNLNDYTVQFKLNLEKEEDNGDEQIEICTNFNDFLDNKSNLKEKDWSIKVDENNRINEKNKDIQSKVVNKNTSNGVRESYFSNQEPTTKARIEKQPTHSSYNKKFEASITDERELDRIAIIEELKQIIKANNKCTTSDKNRLLKVLGREKYNNNLGMIENMLSKYPALSKLKDNSRGKDILVNLVIVHGYLNGDFQSLLHDVIKAKSDNSESKQTVASMIKCTENSLKFLSMYSGISIHSIPFNTDIWNRYKDRDTLYELANVVSNGNVSANSIIYLIYSHCAHRINLLVHNQHNNNLVISHASTHFKIIYRNFDQYRETGIIGLVDSKSVNLEKMEKDSIIKHMIQIYNTSQNQQFLFDVSRLPSNYAIGLGV
jgi:hypothetical protein